MIDHPTSTKVNDTDSLFVNYDHCVDYRCSVYIGVFLAEVANKAKVLGKE
jgi:hypothetical protein